MLTLQRFPRLLNFLDMQTTHFKCPFCGDNGPLLLMGADRFPVLQQLHVIGAGRRIARCPKCGSTDKERLVYVYLKEFEKIEEQSEANILHIAPEKNLQLLLMTNKGYIAGDAFLQNQEFSGKVIHMDICETNFKDNHFDYIICNHVICDIKDDKRAFSEIFRILKPGGVAILQVPITKISPTIENPNVKTKEEREIAYGYGYHERIYNDIDYIKRSEAVGFKVDRINISNRYKSYGLNPEEDIYIFRK